MSHVYIGFWHDYSENFPYQWIWTLPNANATVLSSFFALFISLVGSLLWMFGTSLSTYLLFLNRPSIEIFKLQRYTILCNAGSALDAAVQCVKLCWAWKSIGVWRSHLLIIVGALIFAGGFTTMGTLVSMVLAADNQGVLVRGNACGQWTFLNLDRPAVFRQSLAKTLNDSNIASNYARSCYNGDTDSSLCKSYVKPMIRWTNDPDAPCPFEGNVCSTPALTMDTGYVNSHMFFGINSERRDRVDYRKITTCAPLNATRRIQTNEQGGFTYYTYDFGPVFTNSTLLSNRIANPYTATYFQILSNLGGSSYSLGSLSNEAGLPDNIWEPDKDLNRPDADVTLFALASNMVNYYEPVYDPFFEATEQFALSSGTTLYKARDPDQLVHFMACVDQHQLCDITTSPATCTDASGWYPLRANVFQHPWRTARQNATAFLIQQALLNSPMSYATQIREASALLASGKVFDLTSDFIPNDQWMLEMSQFFATSLARLQRGVVEYTTGATGEYSLMTLQAPDTSAGKSLCKAQKVWNDGAYTNISMFKLLLILAFGIVVICSYIILSVATKGTKDKSHLLDAPQLLRMVLQKDHIGSATEWEVNRSTPVIKTQNPHDKLTNSSTFEDPIWKWENSTPGTRISSNSQSSAQASNSTKPPSTISTSAVHVGTPAPPSPTSNLTQPANNTTYSANNITPLANNITPLANNITPLANNITPLANNTTSSVSNTPNPGTAPDGAITSQVAPVEPPAGQTTSSHSPMPPVSPADNSP